MINCDELVDWQVGRVWVVDRQLDDKVAVSSEVGKSMDLVAVLRVSSHFAHFQLDLHQNALGHIVADRQSLQVSVRLA